MEQEQTWRAVLDGLSEPVVIVDREKRIRLANRAARHALGAGMVAAGEPLSGVIPGDYGARPPVLAEGWRVEPLPDGWVVFGTPGGAGGVRRSEGELHAALGQLAGGIAQELGPPLTAISVAAEFLLRGSELESPATADLEMVMSQVERIGKLSRSLVELARPAELTMVPLRLDALVADGFSLVERQLRRNRVESSLHLDAGEALVLADANQLQQVVINLVLHAQKAALAPGAVARRVAVHTRADGEQVELRIADGGPGLSPEELSRVLLPLFSRAEGLDLAIYQTSDIVHRHGGTLQVQSEPGRGSTFVARFPRQVGDGRD